MLYQFWESVSTDIWYLENDFIQISQEFLSLFREQFNKLWNPILKEFDKNFKDIREQSSLLPYYFLWPDKYGELATNESFRRYWSWYHLAYSPFGIPNVTITFNDTARF